jgi:hypothetical protein
MNICELITPLNHPRLQVIKFLAQAQGSEPHSGRTKLGAFLVHSQVRDAGLRTQLAATIGNAAAYLGTSSVALAFDTA